MNTNSQVRDGSDEIREYADYIQDDEARKAFFFLVEAARDYSQYELVPKPHGKVERQVCYRDKKSGKMPFQFIVSQERLLFRFRQQKHTHPDITVSQLKKLFDEVNPRKRKDGAITIGVRNRQTAEKLLRFVFGEPKMLRQSRAQPFNGESSLLSLQAVEADADDNVADAPYNPQEGDDRQLVERQIRQRRGQQQFRDTVRERYENCCLVTGCKVLDVLEAAHIKPYRGDEDNHAENGLLLRADIHTLFDLDLLGIDPDELCVKLHPRLMKEPLYQSLANKELHCPQARAPSKEALGLRFKQFQMRCRETR